MDLKQRVDRSGITKKKLAELLNISNSQLSHWLNGSRPIPEEKLRQLQQVLERAEKALE